MKLFELFGAKSKTAPEKTEETDGIQEKMVYSGMRVEVSTFNEQVLFVARLENLCEQEAELHQYLETDVRLEEFPARVRIRGYNDHAKKAVYMEGSITPQPRHIWTVEELAVIRIENARAFFRLETDLDATVCMFSGLEIGEKPCKLLNISVGGAGVASDRRYHEGDTFLLKVRLLAERPESAIFCEVIRIVEKEEGKFEYGCRFIELTEEDERHITQNIFEAQIKKRKGS